MHDLLILECIAQTVRSIDFSTNAVTQWLDGLDSEKSEKYRY
ncbi:hypothetical protein SAMN05414139_02473 [Burkholderia sp. D7]|nr:hypothetical protein SAMN05414139_02473 [Burkholderia sp. D7]